MGKKVAAAVACTVAICALMWGCSVGGKQESASSSESQRSATASTAGLGTLAVRAEVEGLEEAKWLDDAQKESLEYALAGYFGGAAKVKVLKEGEHRENTVTAYLENTLTGDKVKAHVLGEDKWTIEPLTEAVEGVNIADERAEIAQMDQYTSLTTSTENIDAYNCIPASNAEMMEELLGRECAAVFVKSLSEYAAGLGAAGIGPLDIVVEKKTEPVEGGVRFKASAVTSVDVMIFECTWNEREKQLAFKLYE